MRERIVKPERRRYERRQTRLSALNEAVSAPSPLDRRYSDRRIQCWNLDTGCTEERRRRCSAYFVKRNCWDLWAAEYFPPGRKPCCHPDLDCSECALTASKFGISIAIYVDTPQRAQYAYAASAAAEREQSFCPHLYGDSVTRPDTSTRLDFKCRHRPGVFLHETYVSEVCSCAEYRACVFQTD